MPDGRYTATQEPVLSSCLLDNSILIIEVGCKRVWILPLYAKHTWIDLFMFCTDVPKVSPCWHTGYLIIHQLIVPNFGFLALELHNCVINNNRNHLSMNKMMYLFYFDNHYIIVFIIYRARQIYLSGWRFVSLQYPCGTLTNCQISTVCSSYTKRYMKCVRIRVPINSICSLYAGNNSAIMLAHKIL